MSLDSPQACVSELAEVNKEIAEFGYLWAENAGMLKAKLTRYDRLHRAGLKGAKGSTVAERDAAAHAAVESFEPGLAEEIEELEGKVESFKVQFKVLERRSSNAQSVLSALREEAKMGDYVMQPAWSTGRA